MPFAIAGITERNYHGTGLLVDAERGLVVTDRNTVPVSLGDVRLTFGGALEIPGQGRVHPSAAQPRGGFLRPEADRHDAGAQRALQARCHCVPARTSPSIGMDGEGELKSRATQVTSVDPL